MSNIIVDGFAGYGVGAPNVLSQTTAVCLALLAGAWGSVTTLTGVGIMQGLPWDSTDSSFYLYAQAANSTNVTALRRPLPASANVVFAQFHCAVASLPGANDIIAPIDFRDISNNVIGTLFIQSTGALAFNFNNAEITTAGPVIVAETAHHYEMKLDCANKAFTLYIDGVLALTGSGLNFSTGTTQCAQFAINRPATSSGGGAYPLMYISDFVIRDVNGSSNNSIPIGDRKVATLFVNRDDASHQGWTSEPLQRFGVGVLDLTPNAAAAVLGPTSTATDIGNKDFTFEGQFRFQSLPTGSNKSVLFGKWDDTTGNLRSYQLYLGGPSLEGGDLVFRTSTDGANGTVVEKAKWAWVPNIGQWYHVAMCRASGVLMLFIDGVQQGINVTDSDTYFVSSAKPMIGGQANGSLLDANTHLQGWQDEFRFTLSVSRYSANFAAPTGAFPRGGGDAEWSDVVWLSSWDANIIADDGPLSLTLAGINSAAAITPNDLVGNFSVMAKHTPDDDTFLQASLLAATGTLTLTATPSNGETVTLATKDGTTAAVYTFKTAITTAYGDVLIGASASTAVNNLIAAINAGAGSGTVYGSLTTANFDTAATLLPSGQLLASAIIAGTVGNALASTETLANGSWGHATLQGGLNIPAYSAFGFDHLPRDAVLIDSVTFQTRQWKSDAGAATTQMSFVGIGGGVLAGAARGVTTTPTLYFDLFEEDPDTTSVLTPQSILEGEIKINRTV